MLNEIFKGLIKHIYQYFVPEALGENPSPTALMNPPLKTPDSLTKAYIPIYDEHGKSFILIMVQIFTALQDVLRDM
jgi:hypothetical protein